MKTLIAAPSTGQTPGSDFTCLSGCQPRSAMRKPFAAAANCKPWQPLPILVYVLTLVRLVVPDETPCRGALSSVSSHVPRDSVTARP
jgi:hypothetical protein